MVDYIAKYWKHTAVIIVGLLIFGALFGYVQLPQKPVSTAPVIPDETIGEDSAKWIFSVIDELDSATTVNDGTLDLYSPANPGERIESLAVNGTATTTLSYPEGKQFFALYYHSSNTWLRYGKVLTMPQIPSYTGIEEKPAGTITVYKRADFNVAADIEVFKDSTKVWDKDTAGLTAFNVTGDMSDTDPPKITAMFNNEDDNTAYVDPRGFFDRSVKPDVADLYANKASYLVVTFERTGGINVSDVADYVKWDGSSGGTTYKPSTGTMYLFVPLNTETLAGTREITSGVTVKSGQMVTIWTATFNWPTSMPTDIYTDDIDIEIAVVSCYSLAAIETKIEQTDMEILGELGSSGVAWSNDLSIGDV